MSWILRLDLKLELHFHSPPNFRQKNTDKKTQKHFGRTEHRISGSVRINNGASNNQKVGETAGSLIYSPTDEECINILHYFTTI